MSPGATRLPLVAAAAAGGHLHGGDRMHRPFNQHKIKHNLDKLLMKSNPQMIKQRTNNDIVIHALIHASATNITTGGIIGVNK